jgi:uncharacterized membrane protein
MKAILFAVLAGLCWGVGEVATKQVLSSGRVGPWTILLVRTLGVVPIVVLAYVLAYHAMRVEPREWWDAPRSVLLMLCVGSALFAGFGGVMFFYLGLSKGEISTVKPIAFALAPAVASLFGWLFLKEHMSAQKVVGIVLMLVGLVLVASVKHGEHPPREQSSERTSP